MPIPGEFAGASLKLDDAADLYLRQPAHPRRIRRGLIEAAGVLDLLRFFSIHPRRIRRGLIEATPIRTKRIAMPRPHPRRIRRGLIEARRPAASMARA